MVGPFGDLPTRFEPVDESRGLGLVLPGRAYSPSAPLLEFARQALLQHRLTVQQVWWDLAAAAPGEDGGAFVRRHVEAALATETRDRGEPERVVVVGKSLGTRASSYAAERGFDAIWLTPILVDDDCVAGIRANAGRQLLVGGLADDLWDAGVAAELAGAGCEVLEIPDAAHTLGVDGDAVRGAEIQLEVARATEAFLGSLALA